MKFKYLNRVKSVNNKFYGEITGSVVDYSNNFYSDLPPKHLVELDCVREGTLIWFEEHELEKHENEQVRSE